MGERVARPNMSPVHDSGFQALRLATELMPSTLALLGADQVSPFWAVLFYFVLILFGIAQQVRRDAFILDVKSSLYRVNYKPLKIF